MFYAGFEIVMEDLNSARRSRVKAEIDFELVYLENGRGGVVSMSYITLKPAHNDVSCLPPCKPFNHNLVYIELNEILWKKHVSFYEKYSFFRV